MRWTGQNVGGQRERWDTASVPRAQVGERAEAYPTVDECFVIIACKPGQSDVIRRRYDALLELGAVYPGLDAALLLPRGYGEMPRCFVVVDGYAGSLEDWLGAPLRSVLDRLRMAEACCQAVVALHWTDGERARQVTWRVRGRDRSGPIVHRQIHPRCFKVRDQDGGVRVRLGGFAPVRNGDQGTLSLPVRALVPGFASADQVAAAVDDARAQVPDVSWDVHALGATVVGVLLGEDGPVPADARAAAALDGALAEIIGSPALARALAGDLAWALTPKPADRLRDARVLLRRVTEVLGEVERGRPVDGANKAAPEDVGTLSVGRWSPAALLFVGAIAVVAWWVVWRSGGS